MTDTFIILRREHDSYRSFGPMAHALSLEDAAHAVTQRSRAVSAAGIPPVRRCRRRHLSGSRHSRIAVARHQRPAASVSPMRRREQGRLGRRGSSRIDPHVESLAAFVERLRSRPHCRDAPHPTRAMSGLFRRAVADRFLSRRCASRRRPDNEDVNWGNNCDNEIIQIGDNSSSTSGWRSSSRTSRTISAGASRTRRSATRYRMFLNRSRQMIVATANRGIVGALMAPDCTRENTAARMLRSGRDHQFQFPHRSWRSPSGFQGRDYEARAVSSPAREMASDKLATPMRRLRVSRDGKGQPCPDRTAQAHAVRWRETSGKPQRSELALLLGL